MSKVFIEESTLTAIGDAIREKTGGTDLIAPGTMPDEIRNIVTGGGDDDFASNLSFTTGKYLFAYGSWNWILEKYPNDISVNATDLSFMFYNNTDLSEIPIQITYNDNSNMESMFEGSGITAIPSYNFFGGKHSPMGVVPSSMINMFKGCNQLHSVSKDDFDWIYWPSFNNSDSTVNVAGLFGGCANLRTIDEELLKSLYTDSTYYTSDSLLNGGFNSCYTLQAINGIYPSPGNETWAWCTLSSLFCLKDFTFAVQEDGTPYSRNWSGVELKLVSEIGYIGLDSFMYWNTDKTSDYFITDAATYELYKDEPEAWTDNIAYSRFDHDSAVRLINSLPDCSSSGGTNTLKLKGESGSATDAGAINTLTDDEIAVATAKGWTITLE